jgi:tetratricopeptide (TPR) repeat protein
MSDLFELAIADKPKDRLPEYQGLGEAFETGYVSLVRGESENAVRNLEEAARKNPVSFVLQLELGRALSLGGDMDRARIELEKAYALRPKDRELQNLLAAVDIQLGRFENAAGILVPLVQMDTEAVGPETVFLLGRALVGLGKTDQALERFKQTVELDGRFHEAFFEAARILKERSDVSGALRLLGQACSLAPDEVPYNRELARLVLDNEIEEEIGLEACDRLMVTDEERQWQYLAWIAELYIRRGWKGEARDPLRKALELVPASETAERRALERRLADLEGNSLG